MGSIVFILKLINNKYYVGSTNNIYSTFQQLFSPNVNNKWLKMYKPLYVHKVVYNCNQDDEHTYLLDYIDKYGLDNVRGHTFDSTTYEKELMKEIKKKL